MFLCRRRFYSDLRHLKKLGASGFLGGQWLFKSTGPLGQWLQELNVEGWYGLCLKHLRTVAPGKTIHKDQYYYWTLNTPISTCHLSSQPDCYCWLKKNSETGLQPTQTMMSPINSIEQLSLYLTCCCFLFPDPDYIVLNMPSLLHLVQHNLY